MLGYSVSIIRDLDGSSVEYWMDWPEAAKFHTHCISSGEGEPIKLSGGYPDICRITAQQYLKWRPNPVREIPPLDPQETLTVEFWDQS